MLLLAQATQASADWVTPSVATVLITGTGALVKWLMSTMTKDMKEQREQFSNELKELRRDMNENARSLEKALSFNTQASHFWALANDEASAVLKAKVKAAEEQIRRIESEKEAQAKARGDHSGNTRQ